MSVSVLIVKVGRWTRTQLGCWHLVSTGSDKFLQSSGEHLSYWIKIITECADISCAPYLAAKELGQRTTLVLLLAVLESSPAYSPVGEGM